MDINNDFKKGTVKNINTLSKNLNENYGSEIKKYSSELIFPSNKIIYI